MRDGCARAAEMACRVLIRRQIRTLPVDPLAILTACRDTTVLCDQRAAEALQCTQEEFLHYMGDAEALTFCRMQEGQMHYLVVYREGGNPARLQFTLAHELGHRLLHQGDTTPAQEREADCFASHLLCPRPALRRLLRRCPTLTASQIASLTYLSPSAAHRLLRPEAPLISPPIWAETDALLADWAENVAIPRG